MAHNHPNQEMLANYTVGGLGNAQSVVIATHLTLCGDCRETIDGFNAIGGALLTDALEEPLSAHLFEGLMKRLVDEESEHKNRASGNTGWDRRGNLSANPPTFAGLPGSVYFRYSLAEAGA